MRLRPRFWIDNGFQMCGRSEPNTQAKMETGNEIPIHTKYTSIDIETWIDDV